MDLTNDTSIYRVQTIDYISFVQLYFASAKKFYGRFTQWYSEDYHLPSSFIDDLNNFCILNVYDGLLTLVFAVLMTIIRSYITKQLIIVSTPVACLYTYFNHYRLLHAPLLSTMLIIRLPFCTCARLI